jgi:hypothetical protein
MSSDIVEKIARAVLYEGYLLYPYRQSALKNRQRWNFGVLYPPAWAASQTGADRSYFQMECVAVTSGYSRLDVSLRFLQLFARDSGEGEWQEAIEQNVSVDSLSLVQLAGSSYIETFSLTAPLQGQLEISAAHVRERIFRLMVRARNTTVCAAENRDRALLHSLASAHTVAQIQDGEFVSQIDPPEELRDAASACQNVGIWPVLVGNTGARNTMFGSPIILYDYPQVAPESKGDLFDATEIDEILTLRILTLTDEEKSELRRTDERARQILERLEASPREQLVDLHGTIRGMQQMRSATVCGLALKKGDRVRLRPRSQADIFDTLLEGKIAIIEAVEEDFERKLHFAVVLEDDPGRDLGEMRQAGHRFFFSADEVEPVNP